MSVSFGRIERRGVKLEAYSASSDCGRPVPAITTSHSVPSSVSILKGDQRWWLRKRINSRRFVLPAAFL